MRVCCRVNFVRFVCVIPPSDFHKASNAARTVLAEERVRGALRLLLIFICIYLFLECVCMSELNISFPPAERRGAVRV